MIEQTANYCGFKLVDFRFFFGLRKAVSSVRNPQSEIPSRHASAVARRGETFWAGGGQPRRGGRKLTPPILNFIVQPKRGEAAC